MLHEQQKEIASAPRGVFVAGTDTGVGKTTFTRGFLRASTLLGHFVLPFKPVETGVADARKSDAAALQKAARSDLSLQQICPFAFSPPVAPVAAARAMGIEISVGALLNARPRTDQHALVVESAGGLLTPLSRRQTNADLACALGVPVVLVGKNGLGTINHCALALQELRRRHLHLAALVLVNVAVPAADAATNADCIADLCGVPAALVMPFAPHATDDELAALVSSSPQLLRLMERWQAGPLEPGPG